MTMWILTSLAVVAHPVTNQDVALSLSKALQILTPLALFMVVREIPARTPAFFWLARTVHPRADAGQIDDYVELYERRFGRVMGFLAWKIGCDLGFFMLMGESWLRAFTPAGLIPYTIAQYLIYRLVGQKMLLGGMLNPLRPERYALPKLKRRAPMRRLLVQYFHEDLNTTSPHVPVRRAALKPLVDYMAVVIAWSAYSMGIFWVQSGEWNVQPLTRFPHAVMIGMYLGGVLAFILGFNLGRELVGVLRDRLLRYLERKGLEHRRDPYRQPLWPRSLRWRVAPMLDHYGFTMSWIGSVLAGILMVALLTPLFFDAVQATAHWIAVQSFDADQAYQSQAALQVGSQQTAPDTRPDFNQQMDIYLNKLESYRDATNP